MSADPLAQPWSGAPLPAARPPVPSVLPWLPAETRPTPSTVDTGDTVAMLATPWREQTIPVRPAAPVGSLSEAMHGM
jgi:hypothetical protein